MSKLRSEVTFAQERFRAGAVVVWDINEIANGSVNLENLIYNLYLRK
ncbi:MAG: hypothetical protein LUB59_01700 [Candidatus Gastranaerophilales bacterium]|nr:hypothetical protein [Candidatus Gastranaerophilales bacterium]